MDRILAVLIFLYFFISGALEKKLRNSDAFYWTSIILKSLTYIYLVYTGAKMDGGNFIPTFVTVTTYMWLIILVVWGVTSKVEDGGPSIKVLLKGGRLTIYLNWAIVITLLYIFRTHYLQLKNVGLPSYESTQLPFYDTLTF